MGNDAMYLTEGGTTRVWATNLVATCAAAGKPAFAAAPIRLAVRARPGPGVTSP